MNLKKFIFTTQREINKISLGYLKKRQNYLKKNKKKFDVVTILDLKIEKFLKNKIVEKFPTHNVYGEELKNIDNKSDYTWFIDPVDGTKNLILGLPTWSNMLGLVKNDQAIISLINYPVLNKFFFSCGGKSYICENNKIKLLKVSSEQNLKKAKIVTNTIHTLKHNKVFTFFKKFNGFFKITGVDSYNFCLIAQGKIDVLIEAGLKIVDIMPLISLVENAGGTITDWRGGKNFKSGNIIATNSIKMRKKIIKIIG